MHNELAARIAESNGNRDEKIALLREAVKIEEGMRRPNGAADSIKPSHELLGEVLLRAGKPPEAAAAFDACLLRMPKRARRSMFGVSMNGCTAIRISSQRMSSTSTMTMFGRRGGVGSATVF